MMKKITNGIQITNAPAANNVNWFLVPSIKLIRPIASVYFSFCPNTILGKIQSIHGPVKLVIARKIIIGLAIGRMTLKKIFKWLAPSILAASSSDLGIVSR